MEGPRTLFSEWFRECVHHAEQELGDDPLLLPERLAHAARAMLPVAGVGIGFGMGEDQVPLGASDQVAALAERLQFTVQDGPGWEVSRTGTTLAADPEIIRRRWSLFADGLFEQTPYRAVLSLAIPFRPDRRVALDLFVSDLTQLDSVPFAVVAAVTEEVADALGAAPEADLLSTPAATDRFGVWVATGIISSRHALDFDDALDLLRAYCFAHDEVPDEFAKRIVAGDFDVADLKP